MRDSGGPLLLPVTLERCRPLGPPEACPRARRHQDTPVTPSQRLPGALMSLDRRPPRPEQPGLVGRRGHFPRPGRGELVDL